MGGYAGAILINAHVTFIGAAIALNGVTVAILHVLTACDTVLALFISLHSSTPHVILEIYNTQQPVSVKD